MRRSLTSMDNVCICLGTRHTGQSSALRQKRKVPAGPDLDLSPPGARYLLLSFTFRPQQEIFALLLPQHVTVVH